MIHLLSFAARAMFRTTAARVGYRGDRPVLVVTLMVLVVVAVSGAATSFAATPLGSQLRDASPSAALALMWFQGAGVVVLVQNAGLGQSGISRGIHLVPLTPLERVAMVSVPLMFITAVSCSTLVSPSVILLLRYTDTDPLSALVASVLSVFAGCCVGFMCWAVAAWACDKVQVLRARAYPISVMIMVGVVSAALPELGYLTGMGRSTEKPPLWFEVVLAWPAAFRYVRTGSWVWAAAAVFAAALAAVVVAVMAARVAPILLREEPPPPVRLPWRPEGRLPIVRLEFARLVRSRRMTSAAATTATMGLFGLLGALLAASRSEAATVDVGPIIGVLVTIPAAQITLLARGLVTRSHPYQLLLGLPPASWAMSLQAASFALAALVIVPVMGVFFFVPGVDDLGLRVVLYYQAILLSATAAFGFAVRPGRDNPAGEFAGLFVGSALPAAVLTTLVGRYGADHYLVPLAAAVTVAAMLPLPAIIERRRWCAALGVQP